MRRTQCSVRRPRVQDDELILVPQIGHGTCSLFEHIGIEVIRPQQVRPLLEAVALLLKSAQSRLGDPDVTIELPPCQQPAVALHGVVGKIGDSAETQQRADDVTESTANLGRDLHVADGITVGFHASTKNRLSTQKILFERCRVVWTRIRQTGIEPRVETQKTDVAPLFILKRGVAEARDASPKPFK